MEIYKTTNYRLFSFLQGNRSVSKKNSLVKSIQKIDLTMFIKKIGNIHDNKELLS